MCTHFYRENQVSAMNAEIRIQRNDLIHFISACFAALGLAPAEAQASADILVAADARGIESHGVARLWRYKNGLQRGIMSGGVEPTVLRETPLSLVLDEIGRAHV